MASIEGIPTLRSLSEWEQLVHSPKAPKGYDIFDLGTDTIRVSTGKSLAGEVPTKVFLHPGPYKLTLEYNPDWRSKGELLTVEARLKTNSNTYPKGLIALNRYVKPEVLKDQIDFYLGVADTAYPLLFAAANYETVYLRIKTEEGHQRALFRSIWRGMLDIVYDRDNPIDTIDPLFEKYQHIFGH